MSAITGFSGVQPGLLDRMLHRLSHWSPDRTGRFSSDQCSMGILELWSTPEASRSPQPVIHQQFVLLADCRIDNRQELAVALDVAAGELLSDVDYLALAYEKWGIQCVHHLYGDFAFVVWDNVQHTFFGARDHLGIKPLYYGVVDGELVFSSEIKALEEHEKFVPDLQEAFFAHGFSRASLPAEENTPYRNVRLFPAGTFFSFAAGELRFTSYWKPGQVNVSVPEGKVAQFAKFETLLTEAVCCRLRTSGKIGAEMSGGLDSTGIAALALRELGKGYEYHSYCFGKAVDAQSEKEARDDVPLLEEFCRQQEIFPYLHILNETNYDYDTLIDIATQVYDDYETNGIPLAPGAYLPDAQQRQIRVLLSGHGGDHALNSVQSTFFFQAACQRQYVQLWKGLRGKFGVSGALLRFLPYVIKGLIQAQRFENGYVQRNQEAMTKNGLHPAYISRFGLDELPTDYYALYRATNLRDHYLHGLAHPGLQQRACHLNQAGQHFNIEYRFPLLDVRLIDYLLSLPDTTIAPGGTPRFLFKKAVGHLLPSCISALVKSKAATVPFMGAFYRRHRTEMQQHAHRILTETDFGKYFSDEAVSNIQKQCTMRFLSLGSLYQKIAARKNQQP